MPSIVDVTSIIVPPSHGQAGAGQRPSGFSVVLNMRGLLHGRAGVERYAEHIIDRVPLVSNKESPCVRVTIVCVHTQKQKQVQAVLRTGSFAALRKASWARSTETSLHKEAMVDGDSGLYTANSPSWYTTTCAACRRTSCAIVYSAS